MAEQSQPIALLIPTVRVSLDFLGDRWNEAYVVFKDLPWSEVKAIRAQAAKENISDEEAEANVLQVIQDAFVEGRSLDAQGALVEVNRESLNPDNFTFRALTKLYEYVIGAIDPKG